MQLFDINWVTALLVLVMGGVRDLGNFLPTDAYWKAKDVAVSIEQLTREVAPAKPVDVSKLIADFDSSDSDVRDAASEKIFQVGQPALAALLEAARHGSLEASARAAKLIVRIRASNKPASVRRLMAIRSLGETKDPKALPALRPLLDSKEMFEAEYARAAIAQIEGKPYSPPTPSAAERAADVNLLPARLDAVMQAAPPFDGMLTLAKACALAPITDKAQLAELPQKWTTKLIETLEMTGNVRIDMITWGFYAAPTNVPGNTVVVLRGEFDPTAVCAALDKMFPESEIVNDSTVYHISADSALLVSSTRRIVYLAREAGGQLEVETMAAALKQGSGTFAANTELVALLQTIDRSAPLWAVANLGHGMRDVMTIYAGPLADFDTITLVVRQTREKEALTLGMQLVAVTSDRARAQLSVAKMKADLQRGVEQGRHEQQAMPQIKPLVDFAESITLQADGGKVTATATLHDVPQSLLSFVFMMQVAR